MIKDLSRFEYADFIRDIIILDGYYPIDTKNSVTFIKATEKQKIQAKERLKKLK